MAKTKKRRARRNVTVAIAFIKATFNNTTVTITDTKGDTLCWASAGTCGFKGSRKSTPFAGQCAAQQAAEKAIANLRASQAGKNISDSSLQSVFWSAYRNKIEELEAIVRDSLNRVAGDLAVNSEVDDLQCFSPAYPEPPHIIREPVE